MLNVITWLWQQPNTRTIYTAKHVNVWARQVRKYLSMPHKLICFTDQPKGIKEGVEVRSLPTSINYINNKTWKANAGKPQCYVRLDMFRRDAAKFYGERFVSMDLDCVIKQPLDPLFDRDDEFIMYKGTASARPYNGSMLMMTAGCRPQVFEKFKPELAERASKVYIGSDQAWISYVLGWTESVWDKSDGVYFFGKQETRLENPPENLRVLFFPGNPKPWQINVPWIKAAYRDKYLEEKV